MRTVMNDDRGGRVKEEEEVIDFELQKEQETTTVLTTGK
jgi:hypothetical protein